MSQDTCPVISFAPRQHHSIALPVVVVSLLELVFLSLLEVFPCNANRSAAYQLLAPSSQVAISSHPRQDGGVLPRSNGRRGAGQWR